MKKGGEDEEGEGRGKRKHSSLPHHQCDERGEAGDMQIQNAQNGEQGSCKYKVLNNGVSCTEHAPHQCKDNRTRLILFQCCHLCAGKVKGEKRKI